MFKATCMFLYSTQTLANTWERVCYLRKWLLNNKARKCYCGEDILPFVYWKKKSSCKIVELLLFFFLLLFLFELLHPSERVHILWCLLWTNWTFVQLNLPNGRMETHGCLVLVLWRIVEMEKAIALTWHILHLSFWEQVCQFFSFYWFLFCRFYCENIFISYFTKTCALLEEKLIAGRTGEEWGIFLKTGKSE